MELGYIIRHMILICFPCVYGITSQWDPIQINYIYVIDMVSICTPYCPYVYMISIWITYDNVCRALMKSMTQHKIIASDASISVQNAAKSLAAGALPQTPLGGAYIYH